VSQGLKGFYRGFTSSLLTNIPSSALWWPSYEVSKYLLSPFFLRYPYFHYYHTSSFRPQPKFEKTSEDTAREHSLHATSGICAGLCATILTNPLDVAKTRVQTRSETYGTSNPFRCISRIVQKEGVWALEKGLIPRLAYNVPASGVAAFTYELALGWSRKRAAEKEPFN